MEENAVIKTYPCQVYECWYASLESAYISITTPKGTTLRIDKWAPGKLKNKWNENEIVSKLVWDIYGRSCEEQKKTGKAYNIIYLTKAEIMLIKEYSNRQDDDLIARQKVQPKKYSAHKQPHKGVRSGICSCGWPLFIKDHGTWVGYNCPKCGQGGSYNKKG